MIVVPKEKPIVENLNSYYLDIEKLIEHYQGELGAGGIYFKSPNEDGVVFFDKDEILNAVFQTKNNEIKGKEAIDHAIEKENKNNYTIYIYEIDPERIYFWANMPDAERIYKDLSTDFTDLEGLIQKMRKEKLTGYIDASIGKGEEGGMIFFNDGEIIGGSYSWAEGELERAKDGRDRLVAKTKEAGGTFQVSRIATEKTALKKGKVAKDEEGANRTITMVEELLRILERTVSSSKSIKADFNTELKKKLVQKADKYAFLDPFADEFQYSNQKVSFWGIASNEELATGVVECVKEMAEELGISSVVKNELGPWSDKYAKEISSWGLSF